MSRFIIATIKVYSDLDYKIDYKTTKNDYPDNPKSKWSALERIEEALHKVYLKYQEDN